MFVVKSKKQVITFALIVFLGISAGAVLRFSRLAHTFSANRKSIMVVLDAGHGLPDGGAVGSDGTVEHEINLSIAKKTQEVLQGKGFLTLMTREGADSLAVDEESTIRQMKKNDMRKRKQIIKESGAELFISIHMNSYPDKSARGLHFFYSANHPEISELAELIQKKAADVTGAKTHAVKTADTGLFLMKNPPVPAILAECGFLSNPEEEEMLKSEEYQAQIAWAIGDAVEEYYKNNK